MRVGGGKPQAFDEGGQGPRAERLYILEESGIVAERAFRSAKRMHIVVFARSVPAVAKHCQKPRSDGGLACPRLDALACKSSRRGAVVRWAMSIA